MPRCNNVRYECDMEMPKPQPHHHIHSLAVAFVINQPKGSEMYDLNTALVKGTIYPDLYKPYIGRGRCN